MFFLVKKRLRKKNVKTLLQFVSNFMIFDYKKT